MFAFLKNTLTDTSEKYPGTLKTTERWAGAWPSWNPCTCGMRKTLWLRACVSVQIKQTSSVIIPPELAGGFCYLQLFPSVSSLFIDTRITELHTGSWNDLERPSGRNTNVQVGFSGCFQELFLPNPSKISGACPSENTAGSHRVCEVSQPDETNWDSWIWAVWK